MDPIAKVHAIEAVFIIMKTFRFYYNYMGNSCKLRE
jgi:hypothetical protein